MRRTDREITDISEIEKILAKSEVLRIALNNGTYPYILPVNFGFKMNDNMPILFFHGSKYGMKHEIIQTDNHVTFETDCGHMLIHPTSDDTCTSSFAYESVIGYGRIVKADNTEKEILLAALLERYGITPKAFNPTYLENTTVYKIHAEDLTAKRKTAK